SGLKVKMNEQLAFGARPGETLGHDCDAMANDAASPVACGGANVTGDGVLLVSMNSACCVESDARGTVANWKAAGVSAIDGVGARSAALARSAGATAPSAVGAGSGGGAPPGRRNVWLNEPDGGTTTDSSASPAITAPPLSASTEIETGVPAVDCGSSSATVCGSENGAPGVVGESAVSGGLATRKRS